MTDEQIEAALARCDAATPGPWAKDIGDDILADNESLLITCFGDPAFSRSDDAEFIAHARENLPAALDELDAKGALLERCRAMLLDLAGGGLGIRTQPDVVCCRCRRSLGIPLHAPDCELAALLRDLGSDDA